MRTNNYKEETRNTYELMSNQIETISTNRNHINLNTDMPMTSNNEDSLKKILLNKNLYSELSNFIVNNKNYEKKESRNDQMSLKNLNSLLPLYSIKKKYSYRNNNNECSSLNSNNLNTKIVSLNLESGNMSCLISIEKLLTDSLLMNKNTHYVAIFKDYMIFDFKDEFLKRFYYNTESLVRLPKICVYYRHYLKFFCHPLIRSYKYNNIIQLNGDDKAELYYVNNYKLPSNNKEINKDKTENKLVRKPKNINNHNRKESKYLFDKTVRDFIEGINELKFIRETIKVEYSEILSTTLTNNNKNKNEETLTNNKQIKSNQKNSRNIPIKLYINSNTYNNNKENALFDSLSESKILLMNSLEALKTSKNPMAQQKINSEKKYLKINNKAEEIFNSNKNISKNLLNLFNNDVKLNICSNNKNKSLNKNNNNQSLPAGSHKNSLVKNEQNKISNIKNKSSLNNHRNNQKFDILNNDLNLNKGRTDKLSSNNKLLDKINKDIFNNNSIINPFKSNLKPNLPVDTRKSNKSKNKSRNLLNDLLKVSNTTNETPKTIKSCIYNSNSKLIINSNLLKSYHKQNYPCNSKVESKQINLNGLKVSKKNSNMKISNKNPFDVEVASYLKNANLKTISHEDDYKKFNSDKSYKAKSRNEAFSVKKNAYSIFDQFKVIKETFRKEENKCFSKMNTIETESYGLRNYNKSIITKLNFQNNTDAIAIKNTEIDLSKASRNVKFKIPLGFYTQNSRSNERKETKDTNSNENNVINKNKTILNKCKTNGSNNKVLFSSFNKNEENKLYNHLNNGGVVSQNSTSNNINIHYKNDKETKITIFPQNNNKVLASKNNGNSNNNCNNTLSKFKKKNYIVNDNTSNNMLNLNSVNNSNTNSISSNLTNKLKIMPSSNKNIIPNTNTLPNKNTINIDISKIKLSKLIDSYINSPKSHNSNYKTSNLNKKSRNTKAADEGSLFILQNNTNHKMNNLNIQLSLLTNTTGSTSNQLNSKILNTYHNHNNEMNIFNINSRKNSGRIITQSVLSGFTGINGNNNNTIKNIYNTNNIANRLLEKTEENVKSRNKASTTNLNNIILNNNTGNKINIDISNNDNLNNMNSINNHCTPIASNKNSHISFGTKNISSFNKTNVARKPNKSQLSSFSKPNVNVPTSTKKANNSNFNKQKTFVNSNVSSNTSNTTSIIVNSNKTISNNNIITSNTNNSNSKRYVFCTNAKAVIKTTKINLK